MRQNRLATAAAVGHLLPEFLRNNALVDFFLLDLPDQGVQAGVVSGKEPRLFVPDRPAATALAEARPLVVGLEAENRVPFLQVPQVGHLRPSLSAFSVSRPPPL